LPIRSDAVSNWAYAIMGLSVGVVAGLLFLAVSAPPRPGPIPPIVHAPPQEPALEEAREGFTRTPSGLMYKVLREGTGRKPTADDRVQVHYKGWLDDGQEFDSSYERNEPAEFGLRDVVPGWTEGLTLVGEGGEIELEIPSNLGYGARGRPPVIPGDATLHFTVELLKVR
jgi:FKBP-type peptidyl-prolyl cis-trans isomerase FkpA